MLRMKSGIIYANRPVYLSQHFSDFVGYRENSFLLTTHLSLHNVPVTELINNKDSEGNIAYPGVI